MTKDRDEEAQRGSDSQDPGRQLTGGWEAIAKQLHRMATHVRRNQGHTQGKDDEPAIVDAHGDSVNPRDKNLTFENSFEAGHLEVKRKKLKGKSKTQSELPMFPKNV